MMMFWWVLVLAILVAAVWWQMRRSGGASRAEPGIDRAEAILRERFARGEIDEDVYRQQLAELRRSAG